MAANNITGNCTDVSIDTVESLMYYPTDKFFVGVCMPILLFIGIIDNIAFILVVVRLPSMRTPTNCYLVHLAVADLLFLIFGMGGKVWGYTSSIYDNNATVLGPVFGCVVFPFLADVSYFASLCFVTLVSFERYIAVCRPQSRSVFQRSSFIAFMCVASWAISILCSSALIPGNVHYDHHCLNLPDEEPYNSYPAEYARCTPQSFETMTVTIYTNLIQTVPFFLSLLFNVYLFFGIVKGLNQSIKRLRGHGGKKDEDTRIRDQIARMLILNGVTFFCCLAPFEVLSLLSITQVGEHRTVQWLTNISRALSYLNSVVNPIIFTTMSQRYREAFKVTFLPNRCVKADNTSLTNGASQSTTNTYIKMTKPKT